MAKFDCIVCGEHLNNIAAPNDVELWVYTDREWDKMMEPDSVQPWMLPLPKYDVWRCTKCKTIYAFKDGGALKMVYRLEKEYD